MLRRFFSALFVFALLVVSSSVRVKAAMTCQLSLANTTVEAGTAIILSGSGCDPSIDNHTALVFDAAGDGSETVVAPIPLLVANNGTFVQIIGVFGQPGNYAIIVHAGNPEEFARIDFTVTEAAQPVTYECGDYVAPGGICPAGCPYKPESATGVVPHVPALCDCGGADMNACPEGNEAGLPTCHSGYSLNPDTGKCEYVQPNEVRNFACGEEVPLELLGTNPPLYLCDPRCPIVDTVCACGGTGQGCCPGNQCNSLLDTCMEPGICRVNTEGIDPHPYLCDDSESVDTAIGCVRFDSVNTIVASITGFLLGLGGAIALILISFASIRIMTSSGDPKALQGGKELLYSAVAGLLMVALSVYILRVIGVDILGLFG